MVKKSLKSQTIERRQSPRLPLRTRVQLLSESAETVVESENHSLTGLFIKSNFPDTYRVNDAVTVAFTDEAGAQQTRSGKIVRNGQDGMAIHYCRDKKTPPIK